VDRADVQTEEAGAGPEGLSRRYVVAFQLACIFYPRHRVQASSMGITACIDKG
jgi:hypothetical protein